jgi:hypothetical protein
MCPTAFIMPMFTGVAKHLTTDFEQEHPQPASLLSPVTQSSSTNLQSNKKFLSDCVDTQEMAAASGQQHHQILSCGKY